MTDDDDELRAKLLCENHEADKCPHDHGEGVRKSKTHGDGENHPVTCFACWFLWKPEAAAAAGYKLVPLVEDYEPPSEPTFDALAGKTRLTPEEALEEGKCVGCSISPDGWSYVCGRCLRPAEDAPQEEWDRWNEWGTSHVDARIDGPPKNAQKPCLFCNTECSGIQSMTCGDCRSPK